MANGEGRMEGVVDVVGQRRRRIHVYVCMCCSCVLLAMVGRKPIPVCLGGECASCLRLSMGEGKLQALFEMVEMSQEESGCSVCVCFCPAFVYAGKDFVQMLNICNRCNKTRKSEYYNCV